MNPQLLDKAFAAFLTDEGIDPNTRPDEAFRAMLRFYRDQRADGCNLDHDRDMLLFQWGTYDWGDGEHFEVDITRQVLLPDHDDDEAVWQLHLTCRSKPTDRDRELGSGNRWCSTPQDLAEFEAFVTKSTAFQRMNSNSLRGDVSIHFENAG